ncbi:hypothetical protein [Nocardiopsis dassonvillei]|uniref:hypothetical protein n=1 Tax=Nocardiopsis dassonvillei TaxID=2014 RepID=UPI00157C94DF|nr:hypothetical protein [Nocardiopsis dassonvillei]
MPSQLSIAQVATEAGVTRADVIRVLTQGGTTEADWHIARTIERLGGRRASELVLLAGRDHRIATIWGDSGETPQAPTPTNPQAKHDPEVRVYGEPTAPDAPPTVLPDHPSEEPEDDTPAERRARRQVLVWAGIAGLTGATKDTVDRLVQRWSAPHALRRGLTGLLRRAAERGSERRRARAQHLLTTYDIAA